MGGRRTADYMERLIRAQIGRGAARVPALVHSTVLRSLCKANGWHFRKFREMRGGLASTWFVVQPAPFHDHDFDFRLNRWLLLGDDDAKDS